MDHNPFRFGLETLIDGPSDVTCFHAGTTPRTSGTPSAPTTSAVRTLPERLHRRRVALLSHPAATDCNLTSSVDVLAAWLKESVPTATLSALLGPQHGLRGEKQDNMIESEDYFNAQTGLPAFSLYGTTRRITSAMADHFDVLLVDLQDVGVRVYTFLTTLGYILEDMQQWPDKEVWVLDRPNPTGRRIEGLLLESGQESFVGVAPIAMQHSLTLGEFARWYHHERSLTSSLTVVPMTGWNSDPAHAWPAGRVWLQPSPNMPALYTARAYPGTVLLEGTTLSEGRGTTRPLSTFGHPAVDWDAVVEWVRHNTGSDGSPAADAGCYLRRLTFQPTFHKHAGNPTAGVELIAEGRFWNPAYFRPYRLIAAILKAIRIHHPELPLWSDPPYEYEYTRLPIDVIAGGPRLREWIEDSRAPWSQLEETMASEERRWHETARRWWLY